MANIIIVDDHKVLRSGLALLIRDLGHEVTGQASDGAEFLNLLDHGLPDIVLMDIQMPVMNGIEATKEALNRYPDLKILILSMFTDEEYYDNLVNLGAKGFILKESEHEEVESAIQAILSGRLYFSQELLVNLLKKKQITRQIELKPRQKEILRLLCQGYPSNEIAEMLHIGVRTVEKERSELMQLTNTSNAISLAIFAVKNNLVPV